MAGKGGYFLVRAFQKGFSKDVILKKENRPFRYLEDKTSRSRKQPCKSPQTGVVCLRNRKEAVVAGTE